MKKLTIATLILFFAIAASPALTAQDTQLNCEPDDCPPICKIICKAVCGTASTATIQEPVQPLESPKPMLVKASTQMKTAASNTQNCQPAACKPQNCVPKSCGPANSQPINEKSVKRGKA